MQVAPEAPDSVDPLCYPIPALRHPRAPRSPSLAGRPADRSPRVSGRAPTCTRPAGGRAPARGNRNTTCRPPGCAPWKYSQRPGYRPLITRIAELAHRGRPIRQQPLLVIRIDPSPRHDPCAVARPDFVLVDIDERIERRRINEPLRHQQRFERLHPQGDIRWRVLMIMMLMIMVVFRLLRAGHGNPRGRPQRPSEYVSTTGGHTHLHGFALG